MTTITRICAALVAGVLALGMTNRAIAARAADSSPPSYSTSTPTWGGRSEARRCR